MLTRLQEMIAKSRAELCNKCEGVKTFRVVDMNGRVLYVHDDGLAGALGYESEDFRNRPFIDYCHPEDCGLIYVATGKMVQLHTMEIVDFRVLHAEGYYVSTRGYGMPLLENRIVVGFTTAYFIKPYVSLDYMLGKYTRRAENTKLCTG